MHSNSFFTELHYIIEKNLAFLHTSSCYLAEENCSWVQDKNKRGRS